MTPLLRFAAEIHALWIEVLTKNEYKESEYDSLTNQEKGILNREFSDLCNRKFKEKK